MSFLAVLTIVASAMSLFGANTDSTWRTELLQWRAQRARNLTAPEGWMSLVGLDWLKPGDNSFGSAKDNAIVTAKAPARMAVIRLEKDRVTLLAPSGGFPKEMSVDGRAPRPGETVTPDDAPNPTKITYGTLTILLIHRGDKYGLRIKDSESPTILAFRGLKWYAPKAAYRVRAKWIPYGVPKRRQVATMIGTTEKMEAPGVAEFTIAGKTYRLEPVIEDPGDKRLFFIMRDTTSTTETYGAGRFLYTEFPDHGLKQPGELWMDFNRTQNPPCAYTPYATCPLPWPENRLQVAIPAGEKRYHP